MTSERVVAGWLVLIPQDTVLLIWMDRSDRKTTGDLTAGYFEIRCFFPIGFRKWR